MFLQKKLFPEKENIIIHQLMLLTFHIYKIFINLSTNSAKIKDTPNTKVFGKLYR